LRNYEVMSEEDVISTAAFMQRCLQLDPTNRPSADELLKDPWFIGAV
jgi:serine/threonine-protein kinase SRPK3